MKPIPGLDMLAATVLGAQPRRRRHVTFVLATLPLYAVSIGVSWHAVELGLLSRWRAYWLIAASLAIFLGVYVLVRSGWSQRLKDPVLTFPHALACVGLCLGAYALLGDFRCNVLILLAQTIVASMFRLRPAQVLTLGVLSAALLVPVAGLLSWWDPRHYPAAVNLTHVVVGSSSLLTLSLIGKWVSDTRVRVTRQAQDLAEAIRKVEHLATTDALTGLLNRRLMTQLLEDELRRLQRQGSAFCIALIDLDLFKQINDALGHQAGDAALQGFGALAQGQLRAVDKVGRWGGEEFLVLLPHLGQEDAAVALERLRRAVEDLRVNAHPGLRLTFSAGLALACAGEPLEQLLDRADRAVYEAKRLGRNRVEWAPAPSQAAPSCTPLPGSPRPAAAGPSTVVDAAVRP